MGSLLRRVSIDEVAGATCGRSLISIRPDPDMVRFGFRLSTPSLAHLLVSSTPGLSTSTHTDGTVSRTSGEEVRYCGYSESQPKGAYSVQLLAA